MKDISNVIARIIRDKAAHASISVGGEREESRFIFHGPEKTILKQVFDLLTRDGVLTINGDDGKTFSLPILLQVGLDETNGVNPKVGESGLCDETHLLDIRNVPSSPSYIALVPPGSHNNQSISTTTDEFGIDSEHNSSHASFEDWWNDGFVQKLLEIAIHDCGTHSKDDALLLVRRAALAVDSVDKDRIGVWRLISRIFSAATCLPSMSPENRISLACGFPAMKDGKLDPKKQTQALTELVNCVSSGFKTSLERLKELAVDEEIKDAISGAFGHIQNTCQIITTFDRSPSAYYVPDDDYEISPPPDWWHILTADLWLELIAEEPIEIDGLDLECVNTKIPYSKSVPAIVDSQILLKLTSAKDEPAGQAGTVKQGKVEKKFTLFDNVAEFDFEPCSHKTPLNFKVEAEGHKSATLKVISLQHWEPGLVVVCRQASKTSVPKKPKGRQLKNTPDWESSLSLPGVGRYELIIFTSPEVELKNSGIFEVEGSNELSELSHEIPIHRFEEGRFQLEVHVESGSYIDIPFARAQESGKNVEEFCRVFLSAEDVAEEGCRSEYEKLIKLNRRHLDKGAFKPVIQLDRNARSLNLQTWVLDAAMVARSYLPFVISEDYEGHWVQPDWKTCPTLSGATFLFDPRPSVAEFDPPINFITSREKIAAKIRAVDDQAGVVESAELGKWLNDDPEFAADVEEYVGSYKSWLDTNPEVATWVDVVAVMPMDKEGRTLGTEPDAILLSPLHPIRLSWHAFAQKTLLDAVNASTPSPAASVIDPDTIIDALVLPLQSPDLPEEVLFVSIENSTDYWSVLWNANKLSELPSKSLMPPFDGSFGFAIGGVAQGFSAAQVERSLDDVTELLCAKPVINVLVDGTTGTGDACNSGLVNWGRSRCASESPDETAPLGSRKVNIYDLRPDKIKPDKTAIANLTEDTDGNVVWFDRKPEEVVPDIGVIAQLDTAAPSTTNESPRSPVSIGGLVRTRIRKQLAGRGRNFLVESRQGVPSVNSGDQLADKIRSAIMACEHRYDKRFGLRFVPNVHRIQTLIENQKANFVAVSSSAVDPACFLGGWMDGAYLWDYDLPSYSQRSGDVNGYYLLSRVKESDRIGLRKILSRLPGYKNFADEKVDEILVEVSKRGIPTVKGLSTDDSGATGDLGLYVAVKTLQNQFGVSSEFIGVAPIFVQKEDSLWINLIVPVDPFQGYLIDLAKTLKLDKKELSLSRPDLLMVSVCMTTDSISNIKLTPIEVKCRPSTSFSQEDMESALEQTKAMAVLLADILDRAKSSELWKLTYQHLMASMIGFGMRVYSQNKIVDEYGDKWSTYHEKIISFIFASPDQILVDKTGRLIVVDSSPYSRSYDSDRDGFSETLIVSIASAAGLVGETDVSEFNDIKNSISDWGFMNSPVSPAKSENPLELEQQGVPIDKNVAPKAGPTESRKEKISSDGPVIEGRQEDFESVVLNIGETSDGFRPRQVSLNISDTRLNNLNIGVVGDLGTGKTQLLKSLIYQIASSAEGNRGRAPKFLIFDYKRDYGGVEAEAFVKATGAKVVKPQNLPFNLFDTRNVVDSLNPQIDRISFFIDILDKIYSGIGPNQRRNLKKAIKEAYSACGSERAPTLSDVYESYLALLGDKVDSVVSIIEDLIDLNVFESDQEKVLPFDEFFDGVVVISLNLLHSDRIKNMIVVVMLNLFYEYMIKTKKQPFIGSDPQLRFIDSYLLVDEADRIMSYEFPVLERLLLEGREFGTGVVLASQYLNHYKVNSTDYREPLLTWFIHKVPNVKPNELSALGFTSDLMSLSDRVQKLPIHNCLYKTFDCPGEVVHGLPFYKIKTVQE